MMIKKDTPSNKNEIIKDKPLEKNEESTKEIGLIKDTIPENSKTDNNLNE